MALKHTYVWAVNGAKITGANWDDDHIVDTSGMTMQVASATPATPDAGNMVMYARSLGGRAMPAFIGPAGVNATLQPFFGRNRIGMLTAPGSNQTAFNNFGIPGLNAGGTARSVAVTSLFQSIARIGFQCAATANANGNWRANNLGIFVGNQAKTGGFQFICRFGTSSPAAVTDGRVFVGLSTSTGALGSTNPTSMLNIIGVGYDAGDVNWSVFHNDGSGTATKTPLGDGFPATTLSTDIYDFALFCAPNSQTLSWAAWRLNADDAAAGVITSDIPVALPLNFHVNVANSASALAVGVDVAKVYVETDN